MTETFPKRLQRLRQERGLRLRDLGKPSTIAQYEAGTRRPRKFLTILHLAQVLQVPPEVLADPLGITAVTLTPQMRTVIDTMTEDPAEATRLATEYMHAAETRGATSELWGWNYVVSRLARQAPSRLPLNAEGRMDIDQAISLAAQWIDRDRWVLAASLLECLSGICPPSSPFYGRLAHNAALSYGLLGRVPESLQWADRALTWGADRQDGWWQVLEAGIISALLCEVPGYEDRLDQAFAMLEAWRPAGAPEPLIQSWLGIGRAARALRTGHPADARRRVRGLLALLESEPAVQPDLVSIADVHARVVALDDGPAAGLAVLEPAMALAERRGDPGYALLSGRLTAVELAIKAERPGAERQLAWLIGYLGGIGADQQVARLQARLGPTAVPLTGLTLRGLSGRVHREEGA